MKKINILIIALLSVVVCSCRFVRYNGDGSVKTILGSDDSPAVTVDFPVDDFSSIDCRVPCHIVYASAEEPLVRISAPQSVMDKLSVSVVDGVLKLALDEHIRVHKNISVEMSSSALGTLNVNGAADFTAEAPNVPGDFTVTANGAADLKINTLKAANIILTSNGASDVTWNTVSCDALTILINGAGDVDVDTLHSESLMVNIAGAGDVCISGRTGRADLTIRGAGDIDVRRLEMGDFNGNVSGMGKIRRK